jgi:hypothetical protein
MTLTGSKGGVYQRTRRRRLLLLLLLLGALYKTDLAILCFLEWVTAGMREKDTTQ